MDGEHHIPVELKTGRVPRGPLFSHILQVAAYCFLLEEEYGKPPPYGIIRYGETSFEIEYNEDQKKLVLQKLAEMRTAITKGGAHRNHNRPGKCIHCSRRSGCPERLAEGSFFRSPRDTPRRLAICSGRSLSSPKPCRIRSVSCSKGVNPFPDGL